MGRGRPGAAAAAGLLAAAAGRPAAAQGHWIMQHFTDLMNCVHPPGAEALQWEGVAVLLGLPAAGPAAAQQRAVSTLTPLERMFSVGSALQDILMPFGVADPVAALFCPLGTSAALHQMAALCLDVLGARCVQRALRLLHLAKLFMLFNFNDYGAWFQHSRWQTDMSRLSSEAQDLARLAKAEAGPGAAAAVLPPVGFRDEAWRIGLVSYCNYNDSVTQLTSLSRGSKSAYASRHSYTLRHFEEPFVDNAHPWMNKLIAIQKSLPEFDWLFWVDCDLFFMNPEHTVDSLIRTALQQSPEASMLIAEDGMMLNSGSFILRNNEWSADFLTRTVDLLSAPMPQSFQHMPWHEQAPLMYLSLVPEVLGGLVGPHGGQLEAEGPLAAGYDPRVALLRQRALNSYPPELVRKTEHALPHEAYEEGDLVISFNGCSSVLGGDVCEAMYSQYCQASLERLRGSGTAS